MGGGQTVGAGGSSVGTGGGTSGVGGGSLGDSGGSQNGVGGNGQGVGGSDPGVPCTNTLPTGTDWAEATCDMWRDAGHCNDEWFVEQGACDESCDRCSSGGGSGGSNNGVGGSSSGGSNNGSGGSNNNGTGGSQGNGNPWGPVNGGQNGWASRYWDCCKQSCGWSNNAGGNPVDSCDSSGNNVTNPDSQSACSGGSATTCNSFAPWSYSSDVSFGFAATHAGSNVRCGTCYKLQFTGSSHNGGSDPGSAALNGKVMIVMATNIGGDVSGGGQLDLLIPGGGLGMFNGCGQAWNVPANELGATYGGLRAGCSGNLEAIKSCVANKCESVFGRRGLDDMYEGCMWYVNWFQAADNPNFRQETIDCPQQLRSAAGL